jgi:hypothetical protein
VDAERKTARPVAPVAVVLGLQLVAIGLLPAQDVVFICSLTRRAGGIYRSIWS